MQRDRSTEVRDVHWKKAEFPMEVVPSGRVMEVRDSHL